MTEPGQTDNYTLSDHIKAIHEHVGKGVIEFCIYDTGEITPEFIRKYNMQGSELLEQDTAKVKEQGVSLIQRNLSCIEGEFIRHNPDAVAASIIELVCEDLKFKDMQNDTQYVMLNDKLKNAKKSIKSEKISTSKNTRSKHEKVDSKKSKFFKKYQERIQSIRESEMKLKQKEMKEKGKSSKRAK